MRRVRPDGPEGDGGAKQAILRNPADMLASFVDESSAVGPGVFDPARFVTELEDRLEHHGHRRLTDDRVLPAHELALDPLFAREHAKTSGGTVFTPRCRAHFPYRTAPLNLVSAITRVSRHEGKAKRSNEKKTIGETGVETPL